MNSHLKVAAKFARRMWSQRSLLKIEDLMLYGSVARGTATEESDVDVLAIHDGNTAFEAIQSMDKRKMKQIGSNFEKYRIFLEILKAHGYDAGDILDDPLLVEFMRRDLLNVQALDKRFFSDPSYRDRCIKATKTPSVYDEIFSYGLLWDPATELYSMPARSKYQVKN